MARIEPATPRIPSQAIDLATTPLSLYLYIIYKVTYTTTLKEYPILITVVVHNQIIIRFTNIIVWVNFVTFAFFSVVKIHHHINWELFKLF